jgi:hypothetical protein
MIASELSSAAAAGVTGAATTQLQARANASARCFISFTKKLFEFAR